MRRGSPQLRLALSLRLAVGLPCPRLRDVSSLHVRPCGRSRSRHRCDRQRDEQRHESGSKVHLTSSLIAVLPAGKPSPHRWRTCGPGCEAMWRRKGERNSSRPTNQPSATSFSARRAAASPSRRRRLRERARRVLDQKRKPGARSDRTPGSNGTLSPRAGRRSSPAGPWGPGSARTRPSHLRRAS